MGENKRLTPQERIEKATGLLAFLEHQAIEDIDDLADVMGIALRARLSGYGLEAFIQRFALRTTQL